MATTTAKDQLNTTASSEKLAESPVRPTQAYIPPSNDFSEKDRHGDADLESQFDEESLKHVAASTKKKKCSFAAGSVTFFGRKVKKSTILIWVLLFAVAVLVGVELYHVYGPKNTTPMPSGNSAPPPSTDMVCAPGGKICFKPSTADAQDDKPKTNSGVLFGSISRRARA